MWRALNFNPHEHLNISTYLAWFHTDKIRVTE